MLRKTLFSLMLASTLFLGFSFNNFAIACPKNCQCAKCQKVEQIKCKCGKCEKCKKTCDCKKDKPNTKCKCKNKNNPASSN